jgi:hypothetical protein
MAVREAAVPALPPRQCRSWVTSSARFCPRLMPDMTRSGGLSVSRKRTAMMTQISGRSLYSLVALVQLAHAEGLCQCQRV